MMTDAREWSVAWPPKFLRDHVEQRRQLGIGSRRGGVEQEIDRGVVTIYKWNAEARSRRHHKSPSRLRLTLLAC